MWLRIADRFFWMYAHTLRAILWFMGKVLQTEQYPKFLAGLSHVHIEISRALLMRAINFSLEHNLELDLGQLTDDPEDRVPDDGPVLNPPPLRSAEKPRKVSYTSASGEAIPLNFDPLPDYTVFEALFAARYGKFGRCMVVVMGRPHLFTGPELYNFLDKIAKDKNAPQELRDFYGSMMSMIVHRHGHKFEQKGLS